MVPVKTTVEDIEKILGYVTRQIGWVEISKAEKAIGSIHDRKLRACVEFGLILRDGANIKATPRGKKFNDGDKAGALRDVLNDVELYRTTLEWTHYQGKAEVTATEIGQYWESSHSDTLGALQGSTLKEGAVCFGRVVQGADLGSLTIGRGGKETRLNFKLDLVDSVVNGGAPATTEDEVPESSSETGTAAEITAASSPAQDAATAVATPPQVSVTASPSVHVNVEIHIAANATADTVREIFKNMARYVLDKHVEDDGD